MFKARRATAGKRGNRRREKPVGGSDRPAGSTAELKEFHLVGEVRKVDKQTHEITIRHERIAGFMEAMTMPFRVLDQAVLDDARPGDQVEGKLEVQQENGLTKNYQLVDLKVVRPAPAAPLVLDLSGSAPQLRLMPKRLEPGDPLPDFELTGQDGKPFRLKDLRGFVVVLTFVYTRCPLPDFCPYMDRKFADLAMSISTFPDRAAKIRLLSVSFDPDHDTPEILRKHARIRGAMPPLWQFAVASHAELAKITAPLGLVYGPGRMKSSIIFVLRSSTSRAAWRVWKSERRETNGHLPTCSRPFTP